MAAEVAAQVMLKAQSWRPRSSSLPIEPAPYEMESQTYSEDCIAGGQRETRWDPGEIYANDHGEPFPGPSTIIERSADECRWIVAQPQHGRMKVHVDTGVLDPDKLTPIAAPKIDDKDTRITYTYDNYWHGSVNGFQGCLDGSVQIEAKGDNESLTASSDELTLCHYPSVWLTELELDLSQGSGDATWTYINRDQFRRLKVTVESWGGKQSATVKVAGAAQVSMELTLAGGRVTRSRWVEPSQQDPVPGKGADSGG